jgi:hypothetical protein
MADKAFSQESPAGRTALATIENDGAGAPTAKAHAFMEANAQSPVIAGRLLEPDPRKEPKGIVYTLKDRRQFRLSPEDSRSMPMPIWDF